MPFVLPKAESGPADLDDGLRPVFIAQGVAKNANGSAYLEVGQCRFQCSVYGPQPLRGEFDPLAKVEVSVNVEPFAGIEGADSFERTVIDFVKTSITPAIVLSEYPKSAISIAITVLSGGPSLAPQLAAAVNVATLALVNAGITLHDMVTAVSVASRDGRIYSDVDVTPQDNQLIAAYMMAKDRLVSFSLASQGHVNKDEMERMFTKARESAVTLRQLFNGFLVENYANSSQE